MTPYDIETVVIGLVLRYGESAARVVLPQLTPEKFIFRIDGGFGADHSIIWEAIFSTYMEKRSPTLTEVSTTLHGSYFSEMRSIVDRLEHLYKVYSLDIKQLQHFADLVDKAGIVYNVATAGGKVYANIADVESFMQATNRIQDIDKWVSDRLAEFRGLMSMKSSGYQHISTIAELVQERWEKLYSGEESILLPCGLPILEQHKLFPRGKMAVLHGLSGSGKSTLAFQINLGVAIHLYQEGIKGCVAINSLEMDQVSLVERLSAILARVDVSKFINRTISRSELDRLHTMAQYVSRLPIFVDDTNFLTTSAMEYRAQGLHVSEFGPVVQLSSDYGELFKDDEGQSEEQRVNQIFREQFRLAKLIGASVIAISQSTASKYETGKTYIAGADGTRYSRGILQAADILVELWNPVALKNSMRAVMAPAEDISLAHPYLLVEKYRGSATGARIPLGWYESHTAFFDLDINQGANPGNEIVFSHLQQEQEGEW